jgi:DNA mismatch repair protein MutS
MSQMTDKKMSPMMKQWFSMKEELGDDVILFCRVGDFYELFFEDAVIGAKELDITLTSRKLKDEQHPLAGVPVRSVESYVGRLVNKGFRVAIADQLEDPKAVKGVVDRGITRIVTKGTLTEDSLLNSHQNNYIASITRSKVNRIEVLGLAIADLSIGEFYAREFEPEKLPDFYFLLECYKPVEYVIPEDLKGELETLLSRQINGETVSDQPNFWFDRDQTTQFLNEHFGVNSLKGFGINDFSIAASAAGGLLKYLYETQKKKISNITKLQYLESKNTMYLDRSAVQSLELFENAQDRTDEGTLVELLDQTLTPMGSRLLRRWIASPLASKSLIETRQSIVELFANEEMLQNEIRGFLAKIADIERLATRVSLGIAKPIEIIKLLNSLNILPDVNNKLKQVEHKSNSLKTFIDDFDPCQDIVSYINKMIKEEPSNTIGEGEVINSGVNKRLDELREILYEGEKWLEKYVDEEKKRTGISSIKIRQNRHLGYYIEVTKSNTSKVPADYISRQVMVNVTRYVTDKLNQWESDILNAEVEIADLEEKIYSNFLKDLEKQNNRLQKISKLIAEIDCLLNFAYCSISYNYHKPEFTHEKMLDLRNLRHPVIENFNKNEVYTPNDVYLSESDNQIVVVTGPNFSGKSSILRAVTLNIIMAQIGCFVPASVAKLCTFDRIFTRIGASDNLLAGQSTFMVEMLDAANLVNNTTIRSFIIADELGRGTSTYDGLAIAWSIVEFLHNHKFKPLVMVATHFHQLSELEGYLTRVKNYHFNIGFDGEKPIFDHKITPGSSDKSFGVEVAKLAGLPNDIILRARFILSILEAQSSTINPEIESDGIQFDLPSKVKQKEMEVEGQTNLDDWLSETNASKITRKNHQIRKKPVELQITPQELEVISSVRNLAIDQLTPKTALDLLYQLNSLLKKK